MKALDKSNIKYVIKVSLTESNDLSKERQRALGYERYNLSHAAYFEGDKRYSIRGFVVGTRGDEFVAQWRREGGDINDLKIKKLYDLADKMMSEGFYFGNLSPKNMAWNDSIQDWVIVDSGSAQKVSTREEVRKKVISSFGRKWPCLSLLEKKEATL